MLPEVHDGFEFVLMIRTRRFSTSFMGHVYVLQPREVSGHVYVLQPREVSGHECV
jgi:hypothetical protein